MSFADKIKGISAAELMAAFPSLPRSTAYDWIAGPKAPPVYFQPLAIVHLEKFMHQKSKTAAPKLRDGG